ncbi:MAG: ExeA family protein, partial [Deferrisomatales bacterium]
YLSPGHDDVYTHLRYASQESKGLVVITGEIGSGKTTLIRFLVRGLSGAVQTALLDNTVISPVQFLKQVCRALAPDVNVRRMDKREALEALGRHLARQRDEGRRVVLIVDEAQNLPRQTIEEVRMLSNLASEDRTPLQIILVGQPELRDRLREKGLEQVLQRVTVHCHLGPMGLEDVKAYVRHRLRVAGANGAELFDDEALEAVFRHSGGVPRLVNILCDTALVFGFGERVPCVGADLVHDVVESRRAGGLFAEAPPAPAIPTPQGTADALVALEGRLSALERRLGAVEGGAEGLRAEFETVSSLHRQLVTLIRRHRADSGKRVAAPREGSAPVAPSPEATAPDPEPAPAGEPPPPDEPPPPVKRREILREDVPELSERRFLRRLFGW